jgi:cbb3-type cytochrome oxidase maturation protein
MNRLLEVDARADRLIRQNLCRLQRARGAARHARLRNALDRRTVHVGLVARGCQQRAPARPEAWMSVLIYLVPIALALGALGLAAYLWALRSGQFDDLDGAAERILFDED